MKSLWRITVPVSGVALICGAAIAWHFVAVRAVKRKLSEDAKACRVRAEQGDANAQSELARLYYHGKGVPQDYSATISLYRKAADQGNPKAQYGLAFLYQQGKGVPQDYPQALDWCRKAATQGFAQAQYALGYTYYAGKEVPQDYTEAASWYLRAADQGYAEAQTDLGYMYSQGKGVPQDDTEAARWYRKAADQGYPRAQASLGYAYSEGKGVPRDYAQSARWYRKAAKHGDEYALRALDAMNIPFTAVRKIHLSVTFLGFIVLLVGSRGSIRSQQQRKVTLAALVGLLWLGLTVYGYFHIGVLLSLSAINAFYFGKGLLTGIGTALLFSFLWQQGFKIALGISGLLFIGFNIYAPLHYDLRRFASCPRAFYSINALLMGLAASLAALLWFERQENKGSQGGNDGIWPATVSEN